MSILSIDYGGESHLAAISRLRTKRLGTRNVGVFVSDTVAV
jgi:hypothetical protein